ncbi:MAG: NUDIX domain-containing protein [Patescibacteria group bacterium]
MSKHSSHALCLRNTERSLLRAEVLLVCEGTSGNDRKDGWHWGLPGGKCCSNKRTQGLCCAETPAETVIRECKEETGYDTVVEQFLRSEGQQNPETGARFNKVFFLVKVASGEPLRKKIFGTETPRWFPLSKLPRNMYRSHRDMLATYIIRASVR